MTTEQKNEETELIVVFKKDVSPEQAEEWLQTNGVPKYRKGMDSSKGKIYFYSTGPKFIVTFNSRADKEAFLNTNKRRKEIHEIYTPDWTLQKD